MVLPSLYTEASRKKAPAIKLIIIEVAKYTIHLNTSISCVIKSRCNMRIAVKDVFCRCKCILFILRTIRNAGGQLRQQQVYRLLIQMITSHLFQDAGYQLLKKVNHYRNENERMLMSVVI